MIGTPLRLYTTTVKASWVDYNEHLSELADLLTLRAAARWWRDARVERIWIARSVLRARGS